MKNQYKIEVDSISLSDSFKQGLKEKMAAEYAAQAVNSIGVKKSFDFRKYSKYIATAACLALVIATITVASAINGGFNVEKASDSANEAAFDVYDYNANDNSAANGAMSDADDVTAEETLEDISEEDDAVDVPVEDVIVEEPVEDTDVTTTVSDMEETAEVEEEEVPEDAVLKSAFAPENYDGEYFAEDYILSGASKASLNVENLVDVSYDTTVTYSTVCDEIIEDLAEVGFIKFEIVEVLSADTANAVAGDESFSEQNTMYRAELIYDYLTNDSADGEIYVSGFGNEIVQQEGIPTFEEGDIILACVDPTGEYIKLIEQMVYVVHRINGVDIAYHLVYENVDPGYTNMGLLDMESEITTTTENNPAIYTHKAAVKELTRYVRRNFEKREFEFANLTSSEVIVPDTEDGNTEIQDEIVSLDSMNVDVSKIKVTIGNAAVNPKGSGSQLRISSFITGTEIGEETSSILIGKNIITYDGASLSSGSIKSIEINEVGSSIMFMVNGVSIGSSWSSAADSLGVESQDITDATVTIAVTQGEEIAYTITVTITNGVISQIIIA